MIKKLNIFIIVSRKNINLTNQIILTNFPIKQNELIKKINLDILKINYSQKSNIKIGKYLLNLNLEKFF